MTVKELIAKLRTMPQDAPVVYSLHSENASMDADDVTLQTMIERNGT